MSNQLQSMPSENRVWPGRLLSVALAAVAGGLLLVSLRLPLWHMRMEAPQYRGPEALNVVVRPGALEGNLGEIKILNQYIGVTVPDTLPQEQWLPLLLCLGAGLGLVAVLLPRRWRSFGAFAVAGILVAGLLVAAGQAQWQMYRIGHDRDHHAALKGVGDFTPPLLGSRKLAQFELTSRLGLGSACIAGALALYSALGLMGRTDPSGRPVETMEPQSTKALQGAV
jgi:copper chaperone NosL